ncbi:MAG: hypothetical protein H9535_14600, partial [Ignavibacteria bacterium]|nr:hypothetical protein [Ignavibacteria bacterium]
KNQNVAKAGALPTSGGQTAVEQVIGLAALEPLAGALCALTLAYIALPSFRYHDEVKRSAKAALHRLDDLNPSEDKCKTHYSRLVKFSNGLADKTQQSRLEKNKIPDTEDNAPYKHWFVPSSSNKWPKDKTIVGLTLIVAFVVLALGVAENFNIFGVGLWTGFTNVALVSTLYFMLLLAAPIPLYFLIVGQSWVRWSQTQIDYLEKHCREEILADSITDKIPSFPPNTAQEYLPENLKDIFLAMAPNIKEALGLAPIVPASQAKQRGTRKPPAKAASKPT